MYGISNLEYQIDGGEDSMKANVMTPISVIRVRGGLFTHAECHS